MPEEKQKLVRAEEKGTPMMRQYFQFKKQYPGMLLLFRLGDFYELFDDDAREVSKSLGLTLTHRDQVPMCGLPYHAAESYINRLVMKRHRVVVCDQIEDPRYAKGLVKRAVTRIVTPSTNLDNNRAETKGNNFLASVMELSERGRKTYGLAFLDVSTGDFAMTEMASIKDAIDELMRLKASEIVYPETQEETFKEVKERFESVLFVPLDQLYFDDGCNVLMNHFQVSSLRGYGCEGHFCGTMCAGAALRYIKENFADTPLSHILGLRVYSRSNFMLLSESTRRNLELVRCLQGGDYEGSLLSVLDETRTPMGSRLLRNWLLAPLLDRKEIEARYDAQEILMKRQGELAAIQETLEGFGDMEKLVGRLATGYGTPRDLLGLRNALQKLPELERLLNAVIAAHRAGELLPDAAEEGRLSEMAAHLRALPELADLLERAISDSAPMRIADGGIIKDGFDPELDKTRELAKNGKEYIAAMQVSEAERTGIKKLKIGFNHVFGYYIEVTKPFLHLVPEEYRRKQTVAQGERFITPELKELETKILHAEEQSLEMEQTIFQNVRQEVLKEHQRINECAKAVAELDVFQNLSWIALRRNYCRPAITDGDELLIKGGRHPVVERLLNGGHFVPNDTDLNTDDRQIMLLTGPNMAGKSTYIRQVAILALMAQSGLMIPADSATIGLTDQIFTRVGASDELSKGQSTFMVEMTETAAILNNATRKSLVILDEISRGTSTYDGLAIAWAVIDYLNRETKVKARTLFATHYHELVQLESLQPGIVNYNVAVRESGQSVSFLHEIRRGGTDRSYGIHVARLAGLPAPVIQRATAILSKLEEKPNELKLSSLSDNLEPLPGNTEPSPEPGPAAQEVAYVMPEPKVLEVAEPAGPEYSMDPRPEEPKPACEPAPEAASEEVPPAEAPAVKAPEEGLGPQPKAKRGRQAKKQEEESSQMELF